MKNLLLGLIATVLLSFNSFGQSNDKVALGCSADCFFNDCMVRCPSGSIPKCKCILGSFSSCSCAEAVGKVSIKNEIKIDNVLNFLASNKYDNFKELFIKLFEALRKENYKAFELNFNNLELLARKEATNAKIIEQYIQTLK